VHEVAPNKICIILHCHYLDGHVQKHCPVSCARTGALLFHATATHAATCNVSLISHSIQLHGVNLMTNSKITDSCGISESVIS